MFRNAGGSGSFRAINDVFVFIFFLILILPLSPSSLNPQQLKSAITEIASQPGASAPNGVRFFRGAMQNIITRALTEAGIKPLPSRRCFALYEELERRAAEVYPGMPGFSATAPPPFGALDTAFGAGGGGAPAQLPDALRGEAWAFVQLPLEELAPELEAVRRGDVFGAVFGVQDGGDFPSAGTPIPGKGKRKRRREDKREKRSERSETKKNIEKLTSVFKKKKKKKRRRRLLEARLAFGSLDCRLRGRLPHGRPGAPLPGARHGRQPAVALRRCGPGSGRC